jgi:hypothetical protein
LRAVYRLKPVILASWEAEIKRSQLEASAGNKIARPPSQPVAGHGGMYLSSQLLGRLRLGRSQFRPAQAKMFVRPHLNGKKLGMVVLACHPSYGKKHNIGRQYPCWPRQKTK